MGHTGKSQVKVRLDGEICRVIGARVVEGYQVTA